MRRRTTINHIYDIRAARAYVREHGIAGLTVPEVLAFWEGCRISLGIRYWELRRKCP